MKNLTRCDIQEAINNLFNSYKFKITPVIFFKASQFELGLNIAYYGFFNNLESDLYNDIQGVEGIEYEYIQDGLVFFTRPLDVGDFSFTNFQGWKIEFKQDMYTIPDADNLIMFMASTINVNGCTPTIEAKDLQLWHNGTEALPQIGDTIYTDADGFNLFLPANPATDHKYIGDGVGTDATDYLCVDENSQRVVFSCK